MDEARGDGASVLPRGDTLRRILQAGIAAPSAENRHFLRFETTPDGVELVATDLASWETQPHRGVLALLAYGAVVENMTLRAAACGLVQHTRWLPAPERPEHIAACRWIAAPSATSDPLERAIDQRHTNRRVYRRAAAAPEALDRIAAATAAVRGARLLWLDDGDARQRALQALRLAETERFRREGLHREIFEAVRFDVGWRQSADEGLPPGALEVDPPARALFAALRRWPLMRAASRVGLHHSLGVRASYLPCRLAPHLALVTCNEPRTELRALEGGRALERAWLAATAEGLAVQPHAAPVALLHQRPGGAWVAPAVQAQLRDALRRITGGHAEHACMFLRVGAAAAPTVVTGRPPLERFLATPK